MPRKPRILSSDFPFHVWARSNNKEPFPIPLDQAWDLFSDYLFILNRGFDIKIHSFVMMPNHIHLLCSDPLLNLSSGMEYFMKETSKEMGRQSNTINKIWGGPFGSSVIKNSLYFYHGYKYIYRNPVKALLCTHVEKYRYSTLQVLLGQKKSVIPIEADTILFDGEIERNIAWLNADYTSEQNKFIKSAIRKKEFKFGKDRSNQNPILLESWESIPFSRRN